MAGRSISSKMADFLFAAKRLMLGHNRVRRARLYCVGTGKSGTHSIASMFSRTVRSKHEPEAPQLIEQILAWRAGSLSEADFAEWLRARDRRLALEVDSSTLNREILDVLIDKFPQARFVLTIRDCYSWCNSHINHAIRFDQKMHPLWKELGKSRMRSQTFEHAPQESLLKEQGVRSLDYYFSYWAWHNAGVLEKVPQDRLLVVRTDQIGQRAFEIADFAGLPQRAVRQERTHEFRNPGKKLILQEIDRGFVEAIVEKRCRPLMQRFFSEIKTIEDVKF